MDKGKVKKTEVVKPHSIITARMDLSSKEQDLVTLLLLSVKKEFDKLKLITNTSNVDVSLISQKYEYSKKQIAEIFGVNVNALSKKDSNKKYLLENACKSLWDKGIEIRCDDGSFIFTRLLSYAKYDGANLTLETPSVIVSELVDYSKRGMGIIDYKLLFKLKGKYDKRILELISRFKNKYNFECTVFELCEMLGTDFDSYASWRSFSIAVLNNPLKSIIRESNGMWEFKDSSNRGYDVRKKTSGKSYSKDDVIVFKMKYNGDNDIRKEIKIKYQLVLDGDFNEKNELIKLLEDLNSSGMEKEAANPEFIKMWSACMATAK